MTIAPIAINDFSLHFMFSPPIYRLELPIKIYHSKVPQNMY